jgi:hypothetical protein
MITSFRKLGLSFFLLVLTSCSRAPSFDVLGSFFPAWLLCLILGLLVLRAHVVLVLPILTYPSLTGLFTFALWLAFFR